MAFWKRFFPFDKEPAYPVSVIRMKRDGHHFYSIMAWENGFEFIFRNGADRWSTISPSLASRIQLRNINGQIGKSVASSKADFLELARMGAESENSSWVSTPPIDYTSRDYALQIERSILDGAWEKIESALDES